MIELASLFGLLRLTPVNGERYLAQQIGIANARNKITALRFLRWLAFTYDEKPRRRKIRTKKTMLPWKHGLWG